MCCADVEAFAQAMETETKPDQDSDSREKEDDEDMSLDWRHSLFIHISCCCLSELHVQDVILSFEPTSADRFVMNLHVVSHEK